jgi:hypothetical protein
MKAFTGIFIICGLFLSGAVHAAPKQWWERGEKQMRFKVIEKY